MSHKILIVDDDQELCELLTEFLQLEGFKVNAVHDGETALTRCQSDVHDVVILDVMLPRIQGFEVLRKLREFSNIPVLMLTARGEDTDRIVGLEIGADDYLPKPCNPRELAARLRAILRRSESPRPSAQADLLVIDDLQLNRANRSVDIAGDDPNLTNAEFNILFALASDAGQVVSKEQLTEKALGRALTAYDRSVDVHVSSVRKKLSACGASHTIKNIRGIGYQFCIEQASNGAQA